MQLQLDPGKTALILIDVQTGILGMPLAPYDRETLVRATARLGRAFADAAAMIATITVAFSQDGGDRLSQPVDMPMQVPPGGLPPEWSTLAPEIAALPATVAIVKRQWSAFHGTELDLQLRRRGIDTIVIGGVATNFGVESTARDGWQLGYAVIVAEDASTSVGADMHEFAVTRTLPRVSRIRGVAEIAQALSA